MGSTIWRRYSREVDRSAVDLLRLARIAGKCFAASWNATSGVKKPNSSGGVCFEIRPHPPAQHCSHENVRIEYDHLSGCAFYSGGAFA